MKKALLTLAAIPFFALCSCSKSEDKKITLPESYSVRATITQRDFEAKADMKRSKDCWEIEILSPESLEGMEITLTEADCRIEYRELEYSADSGELPEFSPIRLTAKVLDKTSASKPSGQIGGEDYSVKLKDGKPVSAEIGSDLTVKFEKFKK